MVCGLISATLACGGPAPAATAPAATAPAATAPAATAPAATAATNPTITLTATDCTAQQLGALLPAHFVATLVNKTSFPAMFTFHRMLEGHAYRELEEFIAEQQRRFVSNEDQLNPPSFTDRFGATTVDSTQTKSSEPTLPSGIYGIVCREQRTPTRWPAYLIGPFRVP
ncbi:MAG TPA: hypothetical protein VI056_12690 [Candidatus Limnocylindria bacterium]